MVTMILDTNGKKVEAVRDNDWNLHKTNIAVSANFFSYIHSKKRHFPTYIQLKFDLFAVKAPHKNKNF